MITVTGYVYKADITCPSCTVTKLRENLKWYGPFDWNGSAEDALDSVAKVFKINREDETTFDSDEFPKVILSLDDDGEQCGECGKVLGS